jgi:hypothetical protein
MNQLIDDIGYALVISVDYAHNNELEAKQFFSEFSSILLASGFNFDNRIFYRLGTKVAITELICQALTTVKLRFNHQPQKFLRSVHLVPLPQFQDITQQLAAI